MRIFPVFPFRQGLIPVLELTLFNPLVLTRDHNTFGDLWGGRKTARKTHPLATVLPYVGDHCVNNNIVCRNNRKLEHGDLGKTRTSEGREIAKLPA